MTETTARRFVADECCRRTALNSWTGSRSTGFNWGCKPKPPKIPSPQPELRSAIVQVGDKALTGTGRTDIER